MSLVSSPLLPLPIRQSIRYAPPAAVSAAKPKEDTPGGQLAAVYAVYCTVFERKPLTEDATSLLQVRACVPVCACVCMCVYV